MDNILNHVCNKCGQPATYLSKRGLYWCDKIIVRCPAVKASNSAKHKGKYNRSKDYIPWNKGLTKETDERVKQSSKTYKTNFEAGKFKIICHKHTLETRNKLSEIRSKYLDSCKAGFSDVGWYKIKNLNGEEFTVRGTWERDFGNYLTNNKILWIRNKQLKYIQTDNSVHRYNPDFYLPELDLYIEVKGYFSEKDKLKTKLVLEQNKINLKFVKEAGIMLIRNNLDEELDKILVNFN